MAEAYILTVWHRRSLVYIIKLSDAAEFQLSSTIVNLCNDDNADEDYI